MAQRADRKIRAQAQGETLNPTIVSIVPIYNYDVIGFDQLGVSYFGRLLNLNGVTRITWNKIEHVFA